MASAHNSTSVSLDEILNRDSGSPLEFWSLYWTGLVSMVLRFPVRIRMVGFRGLQPDDYVGIMVSLSGPLE